MHVSGLVKPFSKLFFGLTDDCSEIALQIKTHEAAHTMGNFIERMIHLNRHNLPTLTPEPGMVPRATEICVPSRATGHTLRHREGAGA